MQTIEMFVVVVLKKKAANDRAAGGGGVGLRVGGAWRVMVRLQAGKRIAVVALLYKERLHLQQLYCPAIPPSPNLTRLLPRSFG